MENFYEAGNVRKIEAPKKKDIRTIRLLICCGVVAMLLFLIWFVSPDHVGYGPIYTLLTIALVFKLVKMIHEWYHYWSLSVPVAPPLKTPFTVDVLTTACPGEPKEMIIRTLRAMVAIRYPHTNYLCDEGNDPELKAICEELGVVHVTRTIKIDAKAGNINNALKQATGDICLVLDPDHVPVPEFLDRVLPYFEDPEIGFVQCVQAYGNQEESIIARGAAEQTYHFYGPMMMCMNSYGTVQAIGANCTFRRAALDSIGGHAAGLSEDMHTAMQLHAKGWKSVYVPELLSRGLVPATLSSYYKQQLKWSRGTFELLFRTLPQLYKNFTWRQKIHYFTIPMYFLFGLINMIDILIPILALILAQVPWAVELNNFAMLFFPLCAISLTIRMFAQRWLLEEHERGFHFAGGILRTATWWIFLIGFIYAIFKIKVPYIPTPKEDEHQNYWKLSIPNFIVFATCVLCVVYGLNIDWSPYSMAMAFYAFVNAGMLGFIVLMSQQKLLANVTARIRSFSLYKELRMGWHITAQRYQHSIFSILRNGPVALILGVGLLSLSYSSVDSQQEESLAAKEKLFGGFYSGIVVQDPDNIGSVAAVAKKTQSNLTVFYVSDTIGEASRLSETLLEVSKQSGCMAMLDLKIPVNIRKTVPESVLEQYSAAFRAHAQPIFLTIQEDRSNPEQAKADWQYLYTFFNDLGISNLTWVWKLGRDSVSAAAYPGSRFVDWLGVSALNYSSEKGGKDWYSFSQLYLPYRAMVSVYQKPVMITELGSINSVDQKEWITDAYSQITGFKEIRSAMIFSGKKIFDIGSGQQYVADFTCKGSTGSAIYAALQREPFMEKPFIHEQQLAFLRPAVEEYDSKFVKGSAGNFDLLVDGKPFYIRGVAYNTGHDWRDGNMPLVRRQVEKDFDGIRAMGANCIRRYNHNIYDRNVLNIAEEKNLKVVFGFWFDPKIDYYRDTLQVQEYMAEVEEQVLQFRDHKAVLAWSVGNETWGLLKHRYSKPYLTKVRESYLAMVEKLAERIHTLDPSRPVFSSMEHEEYQLPGELAAYHDQAPSIDVIGVNSYYKEQLSRLNHVFYQFDSLRPYYISEFGPRGYWDPKYNRTEKGLLVEDSESEKADWYRSQWRSYVSGNKGYNVGGVAYCWHDRMEGSFTWFGLSDFKGRMKPAYYALREEWTGKKQKALPSYRILSPVEYRAGQSLVFTAFSKEKARTDLSYEWYLLKNDYLEKVDNVEVLGDGHQAMVEIPGDPASYRLYLYVTDEDNNTSTASIPLLIE